ALVNACHDSVTGANSAIKRGLFLLPACTVPTIENCDDLTLDGGFLSGIALGTRGALEEYTESNKWAFPLSLRDFLSEYSMLGTGENCKTALMNARSVVQQKFQDQWTALNAYLAIENQGIEFFKTNLQLEHDELMAAIDDLRSVSEGIEVAMDQLGSGEMDLAGITYLGSSPVWGGGYAQVDVWFRGVGVFTDGDEISFLEDTLTIRSGQPNDSVELTSLSSTGAANHWMPYSDVLLVQDSVPGQTNGLKDILFRFRSTAIYPGDTLTLDFAVQDDLGRQFFDPVTLP
ncbi:MAG: hypothetical protein KDC14_11520, partial [Planctomycetes bacterium]|nr:hypothetical protein [Planctomycetota bacterium]